MVDNPTYAGIACCKQGINERVGALGHCLAAGERVPLPEW